MEAASDYQLAIDVGNSGAKAAVFLNGQMIGDAIRFSAQEWAVADRLVTNHGVKNIIYSTVANVPPTPWIDKWESAGRLVLALDPSVPLPFTSAYATMETLGRDRIAVVAGSLLIPPQAKSAEGDGEFAGAESFGSGGLPPRLIVDAGTCATLDLIDATGVYHGGNISPGVHMRLKAMHAFTARLPLVEVGAPTGPVGNTTAAALRHGAQLGLVYEIEGMFHRLRKDYPGLEVLLTGGDGSWLAQRLSISQRFYPHLVLLGLHLILSNYVRDQS